MRQTVASNRRTVKMEWLGEGMRFRAAGTEPESPSVVVDGDSEEGPSPMLVLLMAAGGCSGADVVHILKKMRQLPTTLEITVSGIRREEEPRRFTDIHMTFRVSGDGLDREKIKHAVSLSIEKYCSVIHSLAPDVAVGYDIELA
jgi:putative redox protein